MGEKMGGAEERGVIPPDANGLLKVVSCFVAVPSFHSAVATRDPT